MALPPAGGMRGSRWILAVLLALVLGLSGPPNPGGLGESVAVCQAAASVAAGTLFHRAYGDFGRDERQEISTTGVMAAPDGGFWLVGTVEAINSPADVYVVRLDALGDKVWSRTYGGPQRAWARPVLTTPDGGILLAGSISSIQEDISLIRLNASGDVLWSRTYGGVDTHEWVSTAITTSDGGLLLAGGIKPRSSALDDSDTLLVKLDASGNIQWSRRYDLYGGCLINMSCEGASLLVQTSDGNFVTGQNVFYYRLSNRG